MYGQEDSNCEWLNTLENAKNITDQLQLVQTNFGHCALIIADEIPVSSDTSVFRFIDLKMFIESIKLRDVHSINLVHEEVAQTLYGSNFTSVIVIKFKNRRTMYKIQKRVIEQLKKDN